jgi:hypothetical protein
MASNLLSFNSSGKTVFQSYTRSPLMIAANKITTTGGPLTIKPKGNKDVFNKIGIVPAVIAGTIENGENFFFDCSELLTTAKNANYTIDETHTIPVLAVGKGWWKKGNNSSSALSNPKAQFKNYSNVFTEILEINEEDWDKADPATTATLGLTAGQWTLYSISKVAPAATTVNASTSTALSTGMDVASILPTLGAQASEQSQQFVPSVASQQARWQRLQKRFSQVGGQNADAMLTALAEEDIKVVKFQGNSRGWVLPYVSHFKNSGDGTYLSGSKEKYYGVMWGGSHF